MIEDLSKEEKKGNRQFISPILFVHSHLHPSPLFPVYSPIINPGNGKGISGIYILSHHSILSCLTDPTWCRVFLLLSLFFYYISFLFILFGHLFNISFLSLVSIPLTHDIESSGRHGSGKSGVEMSWKEWRNNEKAKGCQWSVSFLAFIASSLTIYSPVNIIPGDRGDRRWTRWWTHTIH